MDLERIIEGLMVSHTGTIQMATKELVQALAKPEAIDGLCNIMAGHVKTEYRQIAAILLKKHLKKLRNYQQIRLETRQHMKNCIVNTIFNEKNNCVRGSLVQFLSVMLHHESQTDQAWVGEVVNFILNQCCSTDPEAVEIGSFVFGKLADVSPIRFVERFSAVRNIFQVALMSVNSGNSVNISPNAMYNVLTAMSAIVPVMLGCTEVEQTYEAAVPHLVNVINTFAAENLIAHFTMALDILQNMTEYTPMLLNKHVRLLMELALTVSSNTSYDPEIRIKALNYVCEMVGEKKKLLLKLKLVAPIMNVVFNIMSSEPESDDADEFFVESEIETPLAAATVVVDTMATKMPPEKLIPLLLNILEPALNNTTDELQRRAAYIVLASISEGCSEAICDKYLEPMLNILKKGLNDPVASVRNAALFAIGQFSEHLQPEIADYANDVLPLLSKHMENILQAHQMGQEICPKNAERVFYALEAFCGSMEENLAPYMENLMCMVLTLLSDDNQQRLKILAMALTETAAKAYKGSLLPWFEQLIDKLRPLLLRYEQTDADGLRSQAINTLAALARNIDKQFVPFASETMQQCVAWIEGTDDIDLRKSLVNLFGALASVVGENLASVLPTVLNHINRCMEEGGELAPDHVGDDEISDADEKDDAINIDEESNASSETQFFGDNPYLQAKVQSIQTVQELAESCMKILLPFARNLFEVLYKMIDHSSVDIRKSSIAAAKTFIIKWVQCSSDDNSKKAVHVLLQKMKDVVRKDAQSDVVIEAQEGISDILSDLKAIALPSKEVSDSIAECIKEGLTYEYECLCARDNLSEDSQDGDDCESDKFVIEGAANLLTSLGKAVGSDEFAGYFKSLEPYIMKHMNNATEGDVKIERGYLIGVLAECYGPLGKNVGPYFPTHFRIMIRASKQKNTRTRANAIFGLGELIRAGNDISYRYFPEVLETLSQIVVNERKRDVIENIIGALARLILTNATLVPLQQVIPAMLQKLPIFDDEIESIVVMQCFDLLYNQTPESMQTYTAPIVAVVIQSIFKSSCDQTLLKHAVKLMQNIRAIFPVDYQQAMATKLLATLIPTAQEKAAGQL